MCSVAVVFGGSKADEVEATTGSETHAVDRVSMVDDAGSFVGRMACGKMGSCGHG